MFGEVRSFGAFDLLWVQIFFVGIVTPYNSANLAENIGSDDAVRLCELYDAHEGIEVRCR